MKPKKGRSPKPAPKGSRARASESQTAWAIILIDQIPLRRKAAAECQKALARLEKAKAEWKRFREHDVAAYARWTATTFGPLFTRQRELEAALGEKEALLDEIEDEMYFSGTRSPHSAYAKVMRRREREAAAPPPDPRDPRDPDGPPPSGADAGESPDPDAPENSQYTSFDDLSEADQKRMFEDFLINGMGIHPRHVPKSQYQFVFTAFRQQMRMRDKAAAAAGENQQHHQQHQQPPPPRSGPPPHRSRTGTGPRVPESTEARVKELYRLLVRRLHPDTRADSDSEVSAIWHEVQEAYRTRNVERLEMLLALSELQADAFGEGTSLAQMRSVLGELRRSSNALQRNLKTARQDPAWDFSRRTDRGPLERALSRHHQATIANLERHLQSLEAQLAKWAKPPGKKRKSTPAPGQMDFF